MLNGAPENWKALPEYPKYEVSDLGRIKRLSDGVIRKPYLTTTGYFYIVVRNENGKKAHGLHRLVAMTFLGAPSHHKMQAAHFDGNKTNNVVSNIRWATRSENEKDKVRHGRSNRGEGQGRHKLTKNNVLKIKSMLAYGMLQEVIAGKFGVARTTVSSISTGKSWGWI